MTELDILQKRFSDMAQQFPGLIHILTIWPKDDKIPDIDQQYLPTKDNLLAKWGHGLVREYTPGKNVEHWLIKSASELWNKDHARKNFQDLAEKAGRVLLKKRYLHQLKPPKYIMKLSKNILTNSRKAQFWVLVVHELGNKRVFMSEWSDIKTSCLQDLNVKGFEKETIQALYEVQNDFFYESSVIIYRLMEIEKNSRKKKTSSDAKTNSPLSDNALAVLKLLQNLPPYQALTGPKILEALDKKNIFIDQSTLTKSIIPELKPHGVKNKPRIGYYIEKRS